jgi:uncharacterized protein YwgA
MSNQQHKKPTELVTSLVRDAGGKIVGRTRLQKIGYLLEVTGLGAGFPFRYKHYGPYSEELATAARDAGFLGLLTEEEAPTSWGGTYSTYSTPDKSALGSKDARARIAKLGAEADAVELELAATAAFLALSGVPDPWQETVKRKPEKSASLSGAKRLYSELRRINSPKRLPEI